MAAAAGEAVGHPAAGAPAVGLSKLDAAVGASGYAQERLAHRFCPLRNDGVAHAGMIRASAAAPRSEVPLSSPLLSHISTLRG